MAEEGIASGSLTRAGHHYMNWYYVEDGRQAGPVSEEALANLVRSGKLMADTLVWHQGMENWQRWAGVRPPELIEAPVAPPVFLVPEVPGAPASDPNLAACAECGRVLARTEMIGFGATHVCAECKPRFMQKLAEGVKLNTGLLSYAGFWIRFAAKFIDWTILGILFMVPAIYFSARSGMDAGAEPFNKYMVLQLVFQLLYMVASVAYDVFFIGKFGATPGKMLCKLQVVTADGGKVGYGRATGRRFAEILSGMVCYIGYIIAAFDDQRRSLHDHICTTRVILR